MLILIVLAFLSCADLVAAQTTTPSPSSTPRVDVTQKSPDSDSSPLTTFEEEMRAKRAIRMAEKDHQENLNRAREIEQIGKELNESLKNKKQLDRTSLKKLERLEKLTKKIRGEAGGEDEDVNIENRPTDIGSAAVQIADAAACLAKDVQKTPRQVVSTSVIGNANVLLELIRMLRGLVRQP